MYYPTCVDWGCCAEGVKSKKSKKFVPVSPRQIFSCANFSDVEFNQQRFMLDVKKSNSWTMKEIYKNKFDVMRFRHNEVDFEGAFDDIHNSIKFL